MGLAVPSGQAVPVGMVGLAVPVGMVGRVVPVGLVVLAVPAGLEGHGRKVALSARVDLGEFGLSARLEEPVVRADLASFNAGARFW